MQRDEAGNCFPIASLGKANKSLVARLCCGGYSFDSLNRTRESEESDSRTSYHKHPASALTEDTLAGSGKSQRIPRQEMIIIGITEREPVQSPTASIRVRA